MVTKAVTSTKTRKRRSHSRGFSSKKISLAVVAGLIPATGWALDAGRQGNWQGAGERLLAAFTGYEWGAKRFTFMYLNYGLWPLLAGCVAHGLAARFGLNRMISRWGLPVEI